MDSSFQETQVPAPSRRDPAYHGNMAIDKVLSSTTLNTHANFHFQGQQYDRQDPNMEMELSSMIYPAKNEEAGQANGSNGNDGFDNNVWESRAFYTNGPHGMRFDTNGLNGNMLNSNGIVFDPNGLNGNMINSNGPNGNGYAEAKESPFSLVQPNQPHQSQAYYPMDTHMGNAYSNPNSSPYASTYQTYEAHQQQQRDQTSFTFPGNATAETYNHFSIPDVDYPMDHGVRNISSFLPSSTSETPTPSIHLVNPG